MLSYIAFGRTSAYLLILYRCWVIAYTQHCQRLVWEFLREIYDIERSKDHQKISLKILFLSCVECYMLSILVV